MGGACGGGDKGRFINIFERDVILEASTPHLMTVHAA
jgi:hypothetical protein